jgi:transmembrane sensor
MTEQSRRSGVPPAEASAVRRALVEPTRAPLARVLPGELDEQRVPRMWRNVNFRLSGEVARRRGMALRGLALAAALVLGVGAWLWQHRGAGELRADGDSRAPTLLESHENGSAQRFQDGSRIELGPYARLEVLRNDARSFVTVLRRGKSSFDVQPGGPRHWIIEAGIASVEVVGTRFTVERKSGFVHVAVERGVVLVRAENLPHGSVRLVAGEQVDVRGVAPEAELGPALPSAGSALAARPQLEPSALPVEPRLVGRAPLASAPLVNPLPPAASASSALSADEIEQALSAADQARQRGDRAAAVRSLQLAIAKSSPADPRQGIAALSLARLLLPAEPSQAALVLRRSFGAVPRALQEDAWVRWAEAEGRAGNLTEAARLADEYEGRFPNGRRAEEIKRWASR